MISSCKVDGLLGTAPSTTVFVVRLTLNSLRGSPLMGRLGSTSSDRILRPYVVNLYYIPTHPSNPAVNDTSIQFTGGPILSMTGGSSAVKDMYTTVMAESRRGQPLPQDTTGHKRGSTNNPKPFNSYNLPAFASSVSDPATDKLKRQHQGFGRVQSSKSP